MRSALPFRLPTSRMARVVYASVILTSVSLVSIFHARPRVWKVDEVPVAFWAWRTRSPNELDIQTAVEQAKAEVLFLRAGQIDYQGRKLERIRPLVGLPPKGIKLHLVYNTTRAVLEQLESIDPNALADGIVASFREDSERARRDGADVRGLQLDIDFPTRLLPRYEQTVSAIRPHLPPGTELSITGLPTWMDSPALNGVVKNVDFWVPQFYGGEIPTQSSQIIPISSPESITYFVNKARQIDKPFYAGLAAYSVALLYNASGSLISLRGDINPAVIVSHPNLELIDQRSFASAERRLAFRARTGDVIDGLNMRAGDVLVIDLPSSESLRIASRIVRRLAGKKLLGICVFRLPAHDDPATLTLLQVTHALNDEDSYPGVYVRLKRQPLLSPTYVFTLEFKNGGSASPVIGSLKVDLIVPAGSFERLSARPGVSVQPLCAGGPANGPQPCSERRADLLRVTIDFLPPGQTLTTSLILNRDLTRTTGVSVAMQTETEQSYSAQGEIFNRSWSEVMNYKFHHGSFRNLTRALVFIAALAATALGCVWVATPDSVRFNDYQDYNDMGRLPPLPIFADATNTFQANWGNESDAEDNYTRGERRSRAVDQFWEGVEDLEKEGETTEARKRLIAYLNHTRLSRNAWFNPVDREHRRNGAIDKLDALTALSQGSPASRVQAYLIARTLHDQNKPVEEVEQALGPAASDVNLNDNVTYLSAARLYRDNELEEASRAFSALARKYPHSEKREAALFMAALSIMKTSITYTPTSGDEAHLHEGEDKKRHEITIDDAWRAAFAGFKRVMAGYPRGRYFNDARGWIAYLMLRKDDRAAALVEYYRLLSDPNDQNARIEAVSSLQMVRHHATDEELSRVEEQLADEPQVALTYAYHSIFNYSIDPGEESYPDYEEVKDVNGNYDAAASSRLHEEQTREWNKDRAALGRQTVERVLAFSRRLLDRYPKLAVGGGFALRVAEANLELGNNDDAVRFAQRALQSGVQNNERAQALWTIGVAEHRLQHFASARKNLETLIRDDPKGELTPGARRLLAMVAEDSGDIDAALEQYLALKYTADVAYFVDTLMTIEQLAQFVDRHPNLPEKNKLTYSLGLRYLRANLWNDARATFGKVRAVADPEAGFYSSGCQLGTNNCKDAKDPRVDVDQNPKITNELLMLDVQTANDLERLEQAVTRAGDNESTAEALYQLASYQYEASSLLFYNPVLWGGLRYWQLSYFALEGRYRAPNESQRLFAYMQEHETLARALKIYLEIVDRYPHTRAARDAFYSAAVCHERLSGYNPYWRDIYEAGLHAGTRMVTYTDVKSAYPTYQLPRGTYGWQPSTRTVNDGPGWAPPPKPAPRPSRWARIKSIAENFFNEAWVFWEEKVRRWITFIFLLFGVGFTARIAAQNRRLLRPKIVRARLAAPNRTVDPPWTTLFWKDRWHRRKLKQFLSERGNEFWELARDGGSRPILLRNIFSHSFLAGLVISLFWFLHFG